MDKVNRILLNYGVVSPTTVDGSNPFILNAAPDADLLSVKGRNVPAVIKPQAYCHPGVAKAHNGVSPAKEKKINKNRTRKKHKD